MRDKKYQVFVSSTYTDLIEERQAAVEAILKSGNIPAGMELFTAGDESQMTVIKRWIDESDIYLLIVGGRYGSIEKHTGKSYTQLEYEYALQIKKPLFALVISDTGLDNKVKRNGRAVLEDESQSQLKAFKQFVRSNLVEFWDDKKDIQLHIFKTLPDIIATRELVGWIRGDNGINTGLVAEEIANLANENSKLRQELSNRGEGALYFGLTFQQLKDLLEAEIVEDEGEELSLYACLLKKGNALLSKTDGEGIEMEVLKLLTGFKIIDNFQEEAVRNYQLVRFFIYHFTEIGHNFYLKALVEQNKILNNE